jgi:CheY-like chemotaxis protein
MPKAHVLVVDDSEENRDLIRLVLNHQGVTVTVATNGVQALQIVRDNQYQLILMDVQMPEMDGYTAVGKMRELGIKTPVVALTAHAMKGIEQKCIQAGFDGYLGKPIKIDGLLEKVASYIGGKRVERSQAAIPVLQDRAKNKMSRLSSKRDDKAPVVSILQNNEKYRPIVSKFVRKLAEQLEEIRTLHQAGHYEELAILAHKIKGSAGTVGFYAFTEPFFKLETAAQQRDDEKINYAMLDVTQLFERIDPSLAHGDQNPSVGQTG